jgi:hypothetical protein
MPQISKGDTFANSQQLTATRLNQLVDAAQLLVGAISEQPSVTANTLEATDTTLVNDGGTLKKATVGDILNSGLAITSPSLVSSANSDITLTPYDGVAVVGSSYVSANGLTVTVTTLAAHGLAINNVVQISGAGTGYNGTFRVSSVTSLTFQYVMYTAATPTGSPTACTYVRKATSIVNGNEVVSGNAFVNGELDTNNLQVDGQALINSSTTRTANVTTAMQYSGVPVFGLASIDEVTVPFAQADATTEAQRIATCNQWRVITSLTNQTKTDKEIWVLEADFPMGYFVSNGGGSSVKYSIHRLGTATNLALEFVNLQQVVTYVQYQYVQAKINCVIPAGVTFTNETIQLRFRYAAPITLAGAVCNIGYGGWITDSDITRYFRLTKYIKP